MIPVRLELLNERHLAAVAAMLSDPDVLRFTRVPEPTPVDFAHQWLAMYEQGRRDGTREAFAALDGGGEFVGLALAFGIDRAEAEAELGYIVTPAARGRGVGTEALRLLTDWALAEGMARLELLISVENDASKKVAARCGYELEGVLRSVYVKPGRREDTEVWSRLAPGVRDGDLGR
jgi:RimJ/RimL family protein N-acetyltransferase